MRTLALLLLVGLAGVPALGQNASLGQDAFPKPPAPAPPRCAFKDLPQFKGKIFPDGGAKSWLLVRNPLSKFKLPGANPVWLNKLDLRTSVCAVPLLAAPIPEEMHLSTPVLKGEKIDPMPEVQLPAPSCGDQQR